MVQQPSGRQGHSQFRPRAESTKSAGVGSRSERSLRCRRPTDSCDLVAIGPRPPYITGQSVATDALLRHLEQSGFRIKAVNTAPRNFSNRWAGRLSRLPRYLRAAVATATAPASRWAYTTVDANAGMYVNTLYAVLARLRGLRIIAHHHNHSYVMRPAKRMALFARAAGVDAVHITLCAAMSQELRERYPNVRHTLELSNIYTVPRDSRPKAAPPDRFTLGHLSNLSIEKGLPTVINCLRRLRQAGVDAQLRLAGPPANHEAVAIIEAAKAEFPDALVYDGPCYGEAKNAFYRTISVFLFPTEYRNETQGIVNLEALAAGTPVVAYGRCCIPADIADTGGLVVPVQAAFEDYALPRLLHWAGEPAALQRASVAARRRFEELQEESERQLSKLREFLDA